MASGGNSEQFLKLIQNRRTYYELSSESSVTASKVDEIVQQLLLHVPSSFNSQSTRVIVLFGPEHEKLWDIVTEVLKGKVPEAKWAPTGRKMAMFKQSMGTIMFFEDQSVVKNYEEKFPSYAKHFNLWATQSDAMLQFAIWTALEAEGLGANLQHYNPIIDEKVAQAWDVPQDWKLNAQLVFGGRTNDPSEKAFMPLEERYRVFGK